MPNTSLQAFQSSKTDLCGCVSLKSFSLPKPTRGSYSYRDISECSLSFPGQPSKSGLLSLKFKKTCQVDVCASLIAICCCLFYFFFLSMPLLITVWTSTPFPSSGNSFVMLSLRTSGVHGVCLSSGAVLKGICP